MATFEFADRYRAAGITPTADQVTRRKEPFDATVKAMTIAHVVDLTRIYLGLGDEQGESREWFKDTFAKNDPGFSLVNNERECRLLASWLLEAGLHAGNVDCGLIPVMASFDGYRKPKENAEFVGVAEKRADGLRAARLPSIPVVAVKVEESAKITAAVDPVLSQGFDHVRTGGVIKDVAGKRTAETLSLGRQTEAAFAAVRSTTSKLQEEVSLLWWFESSWCQITDEPLESVDPIAAPALIALDAASIAKSWPPPFSMKAVFYRLLAKLKKSKKQTLAEYVDALPAEAMAAFKHRSAELSDHVDIFPVLAAIQKCEESGQGQWYAAYKKTTGLDANRALHPWALSLQVYMELAVLRRIEEQV